MSRRIVLWIPILLLTACAGATPASAPVDNSSAVPFPTAETQRRLGGSGPMAVFAMTGTVQNVALAVHPTDGWPAVAIAQRYQESADPVRIFVRVYDPRASRWGIAQQIDTGASSAGADRFGDVKLAVTGDNTIIAVWGGSDDYTGGGTTTRLWASFSRDYGVSWQPPFPVAANCRRPIAMTSTAPGWVAVLAQCYRGTISAPGREEMRVIVRDGFWQWHVPELLDVPAWYGTEGSITLMGKNTDPDITVITMGKLPAGTVYLSQRPAQGGVWTTQVRSVAVTANADGDTGVFQRVAGTTYGRPLAGNAYGTMFTWTISTRPGLYALGTADGGATWEQVQALVPFAATDPTFISGIAPAYEPRADRLVAIWGCCGKSDYAYNENTHVFSTRPAAGGAWTRTTAPYVPIITGARSSGPFAVAQAQNASITWVAWIEQQNMVIVRSLNLGDLLTNADYPTPVPLPTMPTSISIAGGA